MPSRKYITGYIERYLDRELSVSLNMTKSGYRSYKVSLTLFLKFASNKLRKLTGNILSSEINYRMVSDFMIEMAGQRNWSSSTWNTRLAGVKSFIRFLSLDDPWFLETYRRVRLIQTRRIPKVDPYYLPESTFRPIIEKLKPRSWIEYRDFTMLQFLLATGLRVAEVCDLKVKHILWITSNTVHIRFKGKGRKKRVIPLVDRGVINNLKQLLSFSDVQSEYVFPSSRGFRMSEANLADRIRKIFNNYNLEKRVTPHVLRRSAAMNWLRKDADIFHVSAMLGHEHITTTQKYVRSNLEDRIEEMRRIAKGDTKLEPFKPKESHDEFLEYLKKKTRKSPNSIKKKEK